MGYVLGNEFTKEEEKKVFCEKCGTQVEEDAKFCPNCGTSLEAENINRNDVKTFLLGTQEERDKRRAFIKEQMEKGKKVAAEQVENGKRALSEQKKKMEEQRAIEKARRDLEEQARQEEMLKMQREREEEEKFQQQAQETQQTSYQQQQYQHTNQSYYQNAQPVGQNYGAMGSDGRDYTPISMWGYFGYNILFWIPFIGFILVLVFAFGGTRNINLRNYARSQFCSLILAVILFLFIAGGIGSSILF